MLDENTAWVIAITGSVSTLLTLACTKGVDALLKLRKGKHDEVMDEKKYEDFQESEAFKEARAAYERLQQALEARVKTLETALTTVGTELKETRKEHVACQVEQERLRGELKVLKVHVDRLWQHDQANKEHVAGLEKAVEKKIAAITPAAPKSDEPQ